MPIVFEVYTEGNAEPIRSRALVLSGERLLAEAPPRETTVILPNEIVGILIWDEEAGRYVGPARRA